MQDIMFEGKFVPVCGDVAIMLPMLEMAGFHSRFIPEVLYIYNCDNQISYWHNLYNRRKRAKSSRTNARNGYNLNKSKNKSKKSNEIHAIVDWHIRKEIAPSLPLQESDLVKYN